MNEKNNIKNPSKVYALFYSFFLIPFMLAVFGAMFFFMFQFLTYEKNTPIDLLNNIQSGSATKRWQSAFELSNMLTPDKIIDPNLFESKLKSLFEKSKYDDPKVRTYIALAMGKTQNSVFGIDLMSALNDENISVRIASMRSLGSLRYKTCCSEINEIINNADNNNEKLQAIITMGEIECIGYSSTLERILEDEEANLRWDAAIGLLKMGNDKGIPIVENLLKRDYYSKFPSKNDGSGLNEEEINRSLITAINVTRIYLDSTFKDELLFLSKNDQSIKIKEIALKTIDEYYK